MVDEEEDSLVEKSGCGTRLKTYLPLDTWTPELKSQMW